MQFQLTHKVDSHHTNPNYRCLLVKLLGDPTFHYRVHNGALIKADWMPTDDAMLALCAELWKTSPTFRETLRVAVMMRDFES